MTDTDLTPQTIENKRTAAVTPAISATELLKEMPPVRSIASKQETPVGATNPLPIAQEGNPLEKALTSQAGAGQIGVDSQEIGSADEGFSWMTGFKDKSEKQEIPV